MIFRFYKEETAMNLETPTILKKILARKQQEIIREFRVNLAVRINRKNNSRVSAERFR